MFAIGFFAGPLAKTNYFGQVPAEWSASGAALGWESKAVALYLVPIITAVFYLAFMLLPHIGVYRRDAEHFSCQFQGFKVIFVFVMAVIYIATLLPALGIWGSFDPMYIIVPAIALIFFYIGHMLSFQHCGAAARETAAAGRAWENTNQFGSKLFWLGGALILAALVAPADSRIWFLLLPLIFCALAVFAYSIHEYRKACRAHGKPSQAAKKKMKKTKRR